MQKEYAECMECFSQNLSGLRNKLAIGFMDLAP